MMLLEECTPLYCGLALQAGFVQVALFWTRGRFDGSRSAGTTSPEANRRQIRPLAAAGSPLLFIEAQACQAFSRPPLRLTTVSLYIGICGSR